MCSAVALPKLHQVQSGAHQFSIGSRWLYEADSRFDAAAYSEGAFRALDAIETCGHSTESLGKLCGTIWHPVQTQARSNFKRIYTKPEYGVPFVSSRNMFFLPLRPEKFLSHRMKKLSDLMIPRGWVVVSRSGTVGNVLLINKTLEKCAISDHTIRIESLDIPSGYLYAFLASKFGKALISSSTYGSTVDELEPKHLASIPIPLPPEEKQKSIHRKIFRAYSLRDKSNQLFDKAEEDLYKLLGISPFTEDEIEYLGQANDPQAFEISSSEFLGDSSVNDSVVRFDSKHHVPIVRSVIHKLRQSNYDLIRLGDTDTQISRPSRFKRIYVDADQGIPFFQPSYLMSFRISQYRSLSPVANARAIEGCMLKENEVLVTRSGTAARVGLVTKKYTNWAGSDDMIRVFTNEFYDAGFLTAFFLTPYAKHQVLAQVYGGVVDHIDEHHIANVLLPNVPIESQQTIGDLIRRAYLHRDEANDSEDQAITELEAVISG